MMESEMDQHLGYQKSERSDSDDYRNGYKKKTVNTSVGSLELDVPQDRKSTFEPQIVKKRQKDISEIDQKMTSECAKLRLLHKMLPDAMSAGRRDVSTRQNGAIR